MLSGLKKALPALFLSAVFLLISSSSVFAKSGCCSWHNGVCGCSGGRQVCCDGTLSPSCTCYSPPVILTPKPLPTATPKPTNTPTPQPTNTPTPTQKPLPTPTPEEKVPGESDQEHSQEEISDSSAIIVLSVIVGLPIIFLRAIKQKWPFHSRAV